MKRRPLLIVTLVVVAACLAVMAGPILQDYLVGQVHKDDETRQHENDPPPVRVIVVDKK